jgi:hypothetical protein
MVICIQASAQGQSQSSELAVKNGHANTLKTQFGMRATRLVSGTVISLFIIIPLEQPNDIHHSHFRVERPNK